MLAIEEINRYIEGLLYSFNRPDFAKMLVNSVDFDTLATADTEARLTSLGALLITEKFDVFSSVVKRLNFSNIAADERTYLANKIFAIFSGMILANKQPPHDFHEALKHLLAAICPESILAHERNSGPFAQRSLIELEYARKISPAISGKVFFREFMFGPNTRKHEFGYRIKTALASQGWDVSLLPFHEIDQYSSQSIQDFVLIDLGGFFVKPPFDGVADFFFSLKQYFRKIILIDADPWVGTHNEMILALSDHIDYIWGFTADWSISQEPPFRDRSILFPNVGGFDDLDKSEPAPLDWNTCTFSFTGSVQGYNLNRIYWIIESIARNLPVTINITNPGLDDGLDHEQSLRLYAQTLASTHASLNFTTRRDGSRILTGRAIEVISMNRLLLQEKCPALESYYLEGEHFLDFLDIEGLHTNIEFLMSHPRAAQKISDQGYQFYHEKYSSKKLVEHFQTFL